MSALTVRDAEPANEICALGCYLGSLLSSIFRFNDLVQHFQLQHLETKYKFLLFKCAFARKCCLRAVVCVRAFCLACWSINVQCCSVSFNQKNKTLTWCKMDGDLTDLRWLSTLNLRMAPLEQDEAQARARVALAAVLAELDIFSLDAVVRNTPAHFST